MAHVLASSRYATGLLLRAPEAVAMFGDDAELAPRGPGGAAGRDDGRGPAPRATTAEAAVPPSARLRRRELLRIAAADVLGVTGRPGCHGRGADQRHRGRPSRRPWRWRCGRCRPSCGQPLPTRFAVIAMGRFGGHEMRYGSDADVLFVHEPLPGQPERAASDAAHAVAAELRRLLALPVPDPALVVDADLRPEGRQGPLVRTLAAYRSYYRRWSAPWEAQALLRAEAAAGDADLGAEFIRMIAEFRYPPGGLDAVAVREIRRIKARVEAERIPRGADRALHVKLGPGGLSDVEWTIQLLQLRHAHAVPGCAPPGPPRRWRRRCGTACCPQATRPR